MKKEISDIINSIYPMSEMSSSTLANLFRIETYPKGTTFITKGRRNELEYIILNGVCRSFVLDSEGEEITLSFFDTRSVISPNMTRTHDSISILNIQALTSVQAIVFPSQSLMELMDTNIEIGTWGNIVLQKELMQKVDKEISQASMDAKQRLLYFRKQYPLLENTIPHIHIASYLGITTVSLSRLRKKLMI